MVSEDFLTKLAKSITHIWDADGNEIVFSNIEIQLYKSKYSSSKQPSITLFLDGQPITNLRHKKTKVTYMCDCGQENTIYATKFLKKTKMGCNHCSETEEKIKWHKLFFQMQKKGKVRGNKPRQSARIYNFDNEPQEFKEEYFKLHLTEEEFNAEIRPRLVSVQGVNVIDKDYKYILANPVKNGHKYTTAINDDGTTLNLQDIVLKCDVCGKEYHITRSLREKLIQNNFCCHNCVFSNKVFNVKKYKHLTYQSQLELKFIQFCEDKNIEIEDGLIIPYEWNGQQHLYITDFYLTQLKTVIELKDMHVWHRYQLQTGKWNAKEQAAKNYCKANDLRYMLIYSEGLDECLKRLERDSLTSNEN